MVRNGINTMHSVGKIRNLVQVNKMFHSYRKVLTIINVNVCVSVK